MPPEMSPTQCSQWPPRPDPADRPARASRALSAPPDRQAPPVRLRKVTAHPETETETPAGRGLPGASFRTTCLGHLMGGERNQYSASSGWEGLTTRFLTARPLRP